MFKIRQGIMVVLLLAQGIFEALKEAEDFSQLEEQIQKLSQRAAGQLFVEALEGIGQFCYYHRTTTSPRYTS